MSLRTILIVFLLHLVPVTWIFVLTCLNSECVMGWILFLLIDFPLGWLLIWGEPIYSLISDDYFWRFQVFPALFCQIVGTLNWVLIICFFRKVRKFIK